MNECSDTATIVTDGQPITITRDADTGNLYMRVPAFAGDSFDLIVEMDPDHLIAGLKYLGVIE